MAKEKSDERKKEKKERKRSDTDGVSKSSKKKEKEKKGKDEKLEQKLALHVNGDIETHGDQAVTAMVDIEGTELKKPLLAAMVPFANPLVDERQGKKVLKGVKKAAKNKTLKRGVKEVVKALRKSPTGTTSTSTSSSPNGVVVLAADISPMDVISHIPVLCEDHGVPYIFVPSRAELGVAGATKRPTSVVLISSEKKSTKDGKKEDGDPIEEWKEAYADLVKTVIKAGKDIRV